MIPFSKQKSPFAQKEVGYKDFIPISHLNEASLFETKTGVQGCVMEMQGVSVECASFLQLERWRNMVSQSIAGLSPEFSVLVTQYRSRFLPEREPKKMGNSFCEEFSHCYSDYLTEKSCYQTTLFVTLMIQGPSGSSFSLETWQKNTQLWRSKQKEKLVMMINQWKNQLADFSPRLLTEQSTKTGPVSEILGFLSIPLNGERGCYRVKQQQIASYLPTKRLFIGKQAIEWQGNTEEDRKVGAILSIKQYGPQTHPLVLHSLLAADFEYVSTHSFIPQRSTDLLHEIKKKEKHFLAVKDASYSQREQLLSAGDQLVSGTLTFGYHHHTLMIMAKNLTELEEKVAQASGFYQDMQLIAVRETINLEASFWAQLPGNFHHIRRKALISNLNFADFCGFHRIESGHQHSHLKEAMAAVITPYRTRLWVNFHSPAPSGEHQLSKGHTTIIAPTGAGKTTLMTFLDCQSARFGGRRIFFDRDRGCELYVRARGGEYRLLHAGQDTGLNPFSLSDTLENRTFLVQLLQKMSEVDGGQITDREHEELANLVKRLFSMPEADRHFSQLCLFIPRNFRLLASLLRWSRLSSPSLGHLLDHPQETVDFRQPMLGFDLTHLLDKQPSAVRLPVMMYLFHRIEQQLDGQLVGVYLDEGWQYLNDLYWVTKMRMAFPVWRKKNAYLVFATQSPGTIVESSLKEELIQNSASHFYLPNPKANSDHYQGHFKLTCEEFEWIRNHASRDYQFLFKQDHRSAIGSFHLKGLDKYLSILAGDERSIRLLDTVIAEFSSHPTQWLPEFYRRMGYEHE